MPAIPRNSRGLSAQLAERAGARDTDEELWLALEMKREALVQQADK